MSQRADLLSTVVTFCLLNKLTAADALVLWKDVLCALEWNWEDIQTWTETPLEELAKETEDEWKIEAQRFSERPDLQGEHLPTIDIDCPMPPCKPNTAEAICGETTITIRFPNHHIAQNVAENLMRLVEAIRASAVQNPPVMIDLKNLENPNTDDGKW